MSNKLERGDLVGHFHCIADEFDNKESCQSSDALAVHMHETEDGTIYDAYCWSCEQHFKSHEVHASSLKEYLGIDSEGVVKYKPKIKERKEVSPLTRQQVLSFINKIGYVSKNYRGIKDEYSKFFGHLTKLDKDGKVIARYYPETENSVVTGYKCRNHPKDFSYGKIGKTGVNSDLSGQVKFKNGGGKYVLIVGGEEDKVAAFQMLRDSQIERKQEDYAPIAVVSPTVGEGTAYKQCAKQYEWLDSYEYIVIAMDSDDAGKEATRKICEVLPKEKIKIATWTGKDPNKMLLDGQHRQFVRDFYNAKDFIDSGVKTSVESMSEVEEFLTSPRISLPPYLHKLQHNMRGGPRSTGAIVNIIGDTSIGKSFFGDNLMLHWFYNSPLVPTVISLERTAGEFLTDMYSLHLKKNLVWFEDGMDAVDYLHRPDVKKMCEDLVSNELGQPRFFIIDERDGSVASLKKQVDICIKKHGSKLIIFDPLTDFLRSLGTEEQENFMMWEKMMKKEGVVFLNILHTRKPPTDKEGKVRNVTEYDALGSGTFIQSADINIVLNRDKMATDPIEKNTTYVDMPKCRGGITGRACELFYHHETRQQYDKEDYFKDNPPQVEDQQEDETVNDYIDEYYGGNPFDEEESF